MDGLCDLVVVEIAGSRAGALFTRLFADLGARTVCIEPLGGAPLRNDEAAWAVWGPDTCVDSESPEAQRWLRSADIVVRSDDRRALPPSALDTDALVVDISPFGVSERYRDWSSADIVDQAISGHLYLSGDPDREPLQGPSGQAALAAGVWGAIGALASCLGVKRGVASLGNVLDVSHYEALASLHQFTDIRLSHADNVLVRMGNRYAGPGSPIGMYRASDGWIAFTVSTAAHGEVLLAVCDLMHLLELPGITSVVDVMVNASILDPALNGWLARHTVAEAVEILQGARIAVGPVRTPLALLDDDHLAEREWWRSAEVAGRTVTVPGPPARIGSIPPMAPPSPPTNPPPQSTRPPKVAVGRPLAGVRVLDLTRVWAGPLAARILADLGADVVMVEALFQRGARVMPASYAAASHFYPHDEPGDQPWNTSGFVNKYALGKRSVGLDMSRPEGLAVLERLIASADVLIENFSPRVMPNFGLTDERLHEINPSLVYVTMPGYGRTGPAKDYSAYGPVLDSHAGLSTLMGYPGMDAWKCGIAWPDPVAGLHGAHATLAALWARENDPSRRATTVEVAQFETTITMIGDRIVRAQLDGHNPSIIGNRHPTMAPHGVYRCAGADRWVAVAVTDDGAWMSMVDRMGLPSEWRSWSVLERQTNHDEIDQLISRWTAAREPQSIADALQMVGVASAPVADARDVFSDPELVRRGFFVPLAHSLAGTHDWHGLPILPGDAARPVPFAPAPLLGEHNAEVLIGWGGYSSDDVAELVRIGVLDDKPPA